MWQFQWMLSLIPDSLFIWVTYAMIGVGLALYIASKLVAWIPLMGQYKLPAEIVGIIFLLGGGYLFGGYGVEMSYRARIAEIQSKIDEAVQKSEAANEELDKALKAKKNNNREVQIVIQERIREVEKRIDAECKVDPEAISILNDAASNQGGKKK